MRITPAQNDALQMLAALATLIFMSWSLKYWPAFYHLDQRLHDQVPNRQNSSFWRGVAWIGQPKLTVGYAFVLAGVLWLTADSITALWVLATLGSLDALGIGVKLYFKRKRPDQHSQRTCFGNHGFGADDLGTLADAMDRKLRPGLANVGCGIQIGLKSSLSKRCLQYDGDGCRLGGAVKKIVCTIG